MAETRTSDQLYQAPVDTFDAALITHSGSGTYVANKTDPATGEISVSDGTITRLADKAFYHFRMDFDQDAAFVLEFAGIIPPGGKILKFIATANASAEEPFADVNVNIAGTPTSMDFNRADGIDNDVNFLIEMTVDGFV